jgi:hypothetical protein
MDVPADTAPTAPPGQVFATCRENIVLHRDGLLAPPPEG